MNESDSDVIQVGVIGYGFMGLTHTDAYQRANRDGYRCQVVAVADSTRGLSSPGSTSQGDSSKESKTPFDASEIDETLISFHQHADSVLGNPDIDLVSVCTHTDSHVEIAIKALEAGKHVIVEKPISLESASVFQLVEAAKQSKRICMPAMCMRFWPAWVELHNMIKANRFGKVRSAVFHRLGSRPNWGKSFYEDTKRSGGVLHDLHIHDTDFIVHCFGKPSAVTTIGDDLHLTSAYHYPDAPIHVTAHAGWDHQPSYGFQMQCTIVFDDATVHFDINRDQQLVVYTQESESSVEFSSLTGYDCQARHMMDLIRGQCDRQRVQMIDAYEVAGILECEQLSLHLGREIKIVLP
jgi:predicted dehydrogenase